MLNSKSFYIKAMLFGVNPILCVIVFALSKNAVLTIAALAGLSYLTCLLFDYISEKCEARKIVADARRSNEEDGRRECEEKSRKISIIYPYIVDFWANDFEKIPLNDPRFLDEYKICSRQDAQKKILKFYRDLLNNSLGSDHSYR